MTRRDFINAVTASVVMAGGSTRPLRAAAAVNYHAMLDDLHMLFEMDLIDVEGARALLDGEALAA